MISRLFRVATIVIFILFLLVPSTKAQQIPDPVLNAFTQKFQNAEQAIWEIENDDENGKEYEVEFVLNGERMSAEFTKDGTWKETEVAIQKNELPEGVKQFLRDNFKKVEVEQAFRIITPDQTLFEVMLENEEEFESHIDEMEMDQEENEEYEVVDDKDIFEITFKMDGTILRNEDLD